MERAAILKNSFNRLLLILLVLLACFNFGSCTQISYHSKGFIPVYVTPVIDHNNFATVKGEKEFFLWGLIGEDDEVFLDTELYEAGLITASEVRITEYQTLGNFFSAFFSFGFYIPKNYRLDARGISSQGNERGK